MIETLSVDHITELIDPGGGGVGSLSVIQPGSSLAGVARWFQREYTVVVAKLLLLFTVVPLCEFYLLLTIDELIGLWPTVALVLCTGVVGAWLARAEGLRVLRHWQRSLVRGKVPEDGVLGGVLILVGGVLLVTPGVMTDIVGLLLLIPPTRRTIATMIRAQMEKRIRDGRIKVVSVSDFGDQSPFVPDPDGLSSVSSSRPRNVVMDVEGELIDLDDDCDDDETSEPRDRRVLH